MKRIVAFVKPNMVDHVVFALHEVPDFPGASLSEVQCIGSGSRDPLGPSDRTPLHAYPRAIRIEIVCAAKMAETIIATIRANAHTGLPDDGKIYVSPVEEAVRIRTGERGEAAV